MISVIIPALDAERTLAATLEPLVPAAVDGLVREVIVVDGGSSDATAAIADQAGARVLVRSGGRGYQLLAGARQARFPWLLFLHADTVLERGWQQEAQSFITRAGTGVRPAAATFRFALDDIGFAPRLLERVVALRCALFRLPYGDQGLLIPASLYAAIGGYRPIPLMEDVDLLKRLRRGQVVMLRSRALTDALRYQQEGYLRRPARNLSVFTLYHLGVPTRALVRLYR
ncbi:MAG TPA: TIGR04283 family arsenosugar biosynthesis glycosyltransferase [Hyphomicrobiaceae bacterium]|jgi:rSAM/selenodomain-associated transferase 2|nr:TIGR04283 family arsenosugar biosynthesis glycosyltransferase [Hyphomicrobiaceae bacterium]